MILDKPLQKSSRITSSAPYVLFDRVEVQYSEETLGLRGVSLTIQRGEFVFLLGQTGSGKSTMIKLLSREVQHTRGTVRLGGRDLGDVSYAEIPLLRREMGIVPQDFGLLENRTVHENIAYAMRAVGRTKREVSHQVPEILERVDILHRADAFPRELSGGEQQRVAIGRALINNPPLLLADEPTGNLDWAHSAEVVDLLSQLNLRGTTIIVATHDMSIVERRDARVVRLEFGRVVDDTGAESREA